MKHKVLAYITRQAADRRELLVFTHRDHPEAGVQVPAGTVAKGEDVGSALMREIEEESGLTPPQLRLSGKLAEHASAQLGTVRHVFHLETAVALPDAWTHVVGGRGGDRGLVFEYHWRPLDAELAGNQHA